MFFFFGWGKEYLLELLITCMFSKQVCACSTCKYIACTVCLRAQHTSSSHNSHSFAKVLTGIASHLAKCLPLVGLFNCSSAEPRCRLEYLLYKETKKFQQKSEMSYFLPIWAKRSIYFSYQYENEHFHPFSLSPNGNN